MSATLTVYVMTRDIERLRAFYEAGLSTKAGAQQGNWVPFELSGATFALHAAAPDNDVRQVSLSFGVDDIQAAVRRFEAAGAKVLRGIADETFGRMATLQDPDGRTFEVVQHE